MNLVTITLNPAFDVHCTMEGLSLYQENYGTVVARQAGGKGVNVSRALNAYHAENTAFVVVGEESRDAFLHCLMTDGVQFRPLIVQGRVRENLTIHSPGAPETRISFNGFQPDSSVLLTLRQMLLPLCTRDSIIIFNGRIPEGLKRDAVLSFLEGVKETGARLVIDCNSLQMEDYLRLKPFLMKPNEQEIAAFAGRRINREEAFPYAEQLCQGGIEHVLISFGAEGMAYVGKAGRYRVDVPPITPVSTVGAGDSTVAGFVYGIVNGYEIEETLRLSAAFGTAACFTLGTNPPLKRDIDRLRGQITAVPD